MILLECVVLSIFSGGKYIAVMPEDDNDEGTVYLYEYSRPRTDSLSATEPLKEYEIVADLLTSFLMRRV